MREYHNVRSGPLVVGFSVVSQRRPLVGFSLKIEGLGKARSRLLAIQHAVCFLRAPQVKSPDSPPAFLVENMEHGVSHVRMSTRLHSTFTESEATFWRRKNQSDCRASPRPRSTKV